MDNILLVGWGVTNKLVLEEQLMPFFYQIFHRQRQLMMFPKSNMLRNEVFFSVWTIGNHTFTSIFLSSKFTKLMVCDRISNTCKTILFGVFWRPSDDKVNDF